MSYRSLRKSHSARGGFTLIELLTVIGIILFLLGLMAGVFLKRAASAKIQTTQHLIDRISLGLQMYYADFRSYPPDTGYGLVKDKPCPTRRATLDASGHQGVVCDGGSLWRYLGREVKQYHTNADGSKGEYWRTKGPYVRFSSDELREYSDPGYDYPKSYYVVDSWSHPIGYVGDPKRVVHRRGDCDVFSAGPNRQTATDDGNDHGAGGSANLAYNGYPNDTAQYMGEGVNNGALTPMKSQKLSGEILDDINNWDPQR